MKYSSYSFEGIYSPLWVFILYLICQILVQHSPWLVRSCSPSGESWRAGHWLLFLCCEMDRVEPWCWGLLIFCWSVCRKSTDITTERCTAVKWQGNYSDKKKISGSQKHLLHLLRSEKPCAYFMKVMKGKHALEAKKIYQVLIILATVVYLHRFYQNEISLGQFLSHSLFLLTLM